MANIVDSARATDVARACSPFDLENQKEYIAWRSTKLENYQQMDPARVIPIADISAISIDSKNELAQQIRAFNYAIFEVKQNPGLIHDQNLLEFGAALGLHRFESNADQALDGVTTISVANSADKRSRYIPYSTRGLNWHTDGYYYPGSRQIKSFMLYCQCPAAIGGENFIIDHEMVYLQIRDQAPELLAALMEPDALIIPANIVDGVVTRDAESGPVFSIDESNRQMAMRYSSRPGNIEWKSNRQTLQAVKLIQDLLKNNLYTVKVRLNRGQGLICRNVLHGRNAFEDDLTKGGIRQMSRVRYYDNPVALFE